MKRGGRRISRRKTAGRPKSSRGKTSAKSKSPRTNTSVLIDLGARAAIWVGIVFWLIPWLLGYFAPRERLIFNNNIGPLFALAVLVIFVIYHRDQILKKSKRGWRDLVAFGALGVMLVVISLVINLSYSHQSSALARTLFFLLPQACVAMAAFSFAVALLGKSIFARNIRALLIALVVGIPYVSFSLLARQLWPYLSGLVMFANEALLSLIGNVSAAGTTLVFENFSVVIGEACSGLDSAIMFTGVYIFVLLLDWKRLNREMLYWLFPIGLAGMFLMNILRVSILMVVGAYWSPELSMSLFHDNAGWVLFVLYVLAFWWVIYPRALRRNA